MLLKKEELPEWFEYPKELNIILKQNLLNFEPWIILTDDRLKTRFEGIQKRYANRDLVPFARREDNDDVACFDRQQDVVIIHDFASPGYEGGNNPMAFWDWFKLIVEHMIEHNS